MDRIDQAWLPEVGGALDRDLKEIKVRIPVQYHVQLHSMKILKGQPIHDTVREALGVYLDKFFQGQTQPGAPRKRD